MILPERVACGGSSGGRGLEGVSARLGIDRDTRDSSARAQAHAMRPRYVDARADKEDTTLEGGTHMYCVSVWTQPHTVRVESARRALVRGVLM